MFCTNCGTEIIEGGSFCQQCGRSISGSPGNIHPPGLPAGLTVEDLATFVGKNADKYLPQFAKFYAGGGDKFQTTWHWPAFIVPFWWMFYRKLYGWGVLAFLLGIIPLVGLLFHLMWALVANRLYYNHTKKNILEIKNLHPTAGEQKAALHAKGGVGYAALIIAGILGLIVILGIIAAVAIPQFLYYREKAIHTSLSPIGHLSLTIFTSWP
jgi:hypothetical protein